MRPITEQALHLVEQNAPDFKDAVAEAKLLSRGRRKAAAVSVRLDSFEDDPFLLYSCLWFALSEGVETRFIAKGTHF